MKERKVLQEEVVVTWDCLFKIFRLLFIFFLLLSAVTIKAQEIPVRQRFNPGEEVQYELFFKLGFLMPRAGVATLSIQEDFFENQPAYHYRLLFHTSGIVERIPARHLGPRCRHRGRRHHGHRRHAPGRAPGRGLLPHPPGGCEQPSGSPGAGDLRYRKPDSDGCPVFVTIYKFFHSSLSMPTISTGNLGCYNDNA